MALIGIASGVGMVCTAPFIGMALVCLTPFVVAYLGFGTVCLAPFIGLTGICAEMPIVCLVAPLVIFDPEFLSEISQIQIPPPM
jgi:hypothetical protein